MADNDYTRWVERAEEALQEIETLRYDAPDPDLAELVADAEDKVRSAQELCGSRA